MGWNQDCEGISAVPQPVSEIIPLFPSISAGSRAAPRRADADRCVHGMHGLPCMLLIGDGEGSCVHIGKIFTSISQYKYQVYTPVYIYIQIPYPVSHNGYLLSPGTLVRSARLRAAASRGRPASGGLRSQQVLVCTHSSRYSYQRVLYFNLRARPTLTWFAQFCSFT